MAQTPTVFTQDQFDEFARLSGDDNPIHVDPAFSARTRFGRTVAHGMHLFAVLQAELAREVGGPVRLSGQDFVFRAPTFAGEPLLLTLNHLDTGVVEETVTDTAGTVLADGNAMLGTLGPEEPGEPIKAASAGYKGLEVGMSASRSRVFTPDDVADYLDLINDPNPLYRGRNPELPPSLLGGMVSRLLGVDLPGRGTNWLKQRYRFYRAVTAPSEVTTTVTITRLRPEKGLVNLTSICVIDGSTAVAGESLVLATDVAPR
jgi:acyl dehydratase